MKNKNLIIFILLMSVAIATRFLLLGARPAHHDEGMLSYFAWELSQGRGYTYTPQIHGPILFYLQAIVFKLFGTGTGAVRASMAMFGVLLVALPFLYRKAFSYRRAVAISALVVSSPILTYFARFSVHTALVVVVNFIIVINLWLFLKKPKSIYLYVLAICFALAFGISETSYIFVGTLVLSALVYYLVDRQGFVEKLRSVIKYLKQNYLDLISAFLLFILSWIMIYSVGLTSPASFMLSLPNPFNTQGGLGFWLSQHNNKLGGQPWFYYIILLAVYEPLVLLGALLAAVESARRKGGFLQGFTLLLAVLSLAGYSIAGEKFPWLILPTLILFVMSAGLYFGQNFHKSRVITKIIILILFIFTIFSMYRLNFISPGDTRELVTYVQTPKSFGAVVDEAREGCQGVGSECVVIDSDIGWPLSWEFKGISYLDNMDSDIQIKPNTKYVFANPEKEGKLDQSNFDISRVKLRDWWVPPVCRKSECIGTYLNYFVSRTIWGAKGGYDVIFMGRK